MHIVIPSSCDSAVLSRHLVIFTLNNQIKFSFSNFIFEMIWKFRLSWSSLIFSVWNFINHNMFRSERYRTLRDYSKVCLYSVLKTSQKLIPLIPCVPFQSGLRLNYFSIENVWSKLRSLLAVCLKIFFLHQLSDLELYFIDFVPNNFVELTIQFGVRMQI